ncbi:MAG: PaaI family thioesterase, partial [Bacteroidales bacterium]|nr:PaaI family thioesterase [Bacteroidales bacterium]
MKRIINPYRRLEGYDCFGCSPDNPIGLQMEFYEEGEEILCKWHPGNHYQGYHNILHGGIQATLMDEIASWVVQIKLKTAGVTSRMNIRYRNQVLVTDDEITLRARLKGMRRNLADINTELYDSSGKCCAEACVTYYSFSEEEARKKLNYPAHETFH